MTALILVDIQNDFVPGGALAVPRGRRGRPDRQPAPDALRAGRRHAGLASRGSRQLRRQSSRPKVGEVIDLNGLPQILWPVHCVQNTPRRGVRRRRSTRSTHRTVFQKGTDPAIDSYSGFFDNGHRKATGLGD